jgi:Ca2+/H+ antiporter
VCAVIGGFKRQKLVVIPESAGMKCFFLFHQRPHVFLLSVTLQVHETRTSCASDRFVRLEVHVPVTGL